MAGSEVRFAVRRRARFSAVRELVPTAGREAEGTALLGRDEGSSGHDYTLFVTVEGETPPETGMVLDLKALSALLRSAIVAPLDRQRLDRWDGLGGLPATAENLAVAIWRRLARRLPTGRLAEVELWEGFEKCVRYRGE